jgi:hypothetical protein
MTSSHAVDALRGELYTRINEAALPDTLARRLRARVDSVLKDQASFLAHQTEDGFNEAATLLRMQFEEAIKGAGGLQQAGGFSGREDARSVSRSVPGGGRFA